MNEKVKRFMDSKVLVGLISFLATVIVSIVFLAVESLSSEIKGFQNGAVERTARIVALETSQEYMNKKLDSMEKKIDLVINKIDAHVMESKK